MSDSRIGRRTPLAVCAALVVFSVGPGEALAQFGSTTPRAAARRVESRHTFVELIADRNPDASTRELWAGLRFELEQGWHVYWRNPGDSGGPPTVLWQPAPGVTVGEFEWPAPQRILLGPLVNYGYTNEVILPFRVQLAPAAGGKVTLEGDAKWLICHDICITGQARLALTLPVSGPDAPRLPTWARQIKEARTLVPKLAPAAWQPRVSATKDTFILTVRMNRTQATATFFPLEVSQVNESAAQQVQAGGGVLVVTLKKSDQLTADPTTLKGVLFLPSEGSFVIEAPVRTDGKVMERECAGRPNAEWCRSVSAGSRAPVTARSGRG